MTSQRDNINAIEWWLTGYTIKDGDKITMERERTAACLSSKKITAAWQYWYIEEIYAALTQKYSIAWHWNLLPTFRYTRRTRVFAFYINRRQAARSRLVDCTYGNQNVRCMETEASSVDYCMHGRLFVSSNLERTSWIDTRPWTWAGESHRLHYRWPERLILTRS